LLKRNEGRNLLAPVCALFCLPRVPQQLRQLGDVGGDASRLILGEQARR
jgi:hypothetical protein